MDRQYAALKYVLYTLLGSVFMLVGIIWFISTITSGDDASRRAFV